MKKQANPMFDPKIYTLGYTGVPQAKLFERIRQLDAVLLDIRYNAWSRAPIWMPKHMAGLLGVHYLQCPTLGNKAYRTGGMEIADYATGKQTIINISLNHHPVVLMCACKEPDGCHRWEVAKLLAKDGFPILGELQLEDPEASAPPPAPPTPSQLTLF